MNIPPCANALEGVCPRSDTYISSEKDDCFVIICRTCSGINIFPKSKDEAKGRYEAGLKREALKQQALDAVKRQKAFNIGGGTK